MENFKLTQEQIDNADIYDDEKHKYESNYLANYFRIKLKLLENHKVDCLTHGMEEYTVSDKYSYGIHGFCFTDTFAGWQNTCSVHMDAKFKCGKEFPIGYYFTYRNKDLIETLSKLEKMSDMEFIRGKRWDDKNHLMIITGMRKNDFSDMPGHYGF